MRKKLTAEQIAKRDERRARFKELWKRVADMPEAERVQIANRVGIVTCDGRPLSDKNMLLVALQCPTATVVGGFRQWIKQGRCVRKGEHGAMIWCPTVKSNDTTAPAGEPAETEVPERRFIVGTVFDISQTQELEEKEAA